MIFGLVCAAVAAMVAPCSPGVSVLVGVLSGAGFSAFFSLFMGRLIHLQTTLAELLADIKAWDSKPNDSLAHAVQIRLELLTDIGYHSDSPLVEEMKPMVAKIRKGCDHGELAGPLYALLQRSLVSTVFGSMFSPEYPHQNK